MVGIKCNIVGIPESLLHLLITLFPNLECAFSSYDEFSAETHHVDCDSWASKFGNPCTCFHPNFAEFTLNWVTNWLYNDSIHSKDDVHIERN